MRRYVRNLASISVGAQATVAAIVVRASDSNRGELLINGFSEVGDRLSDAEVMARYGVDGIVVLHGDRVLKVIVNER